MTSANQRRILSVLRFMEMQLRSGSSSSQVLRNKEKESRASRLTARSLNRCRHQSCGSLSSANPCTLNPKPSVKPQARKPKPNESDQRQGNRDVIPKHGFLYPLCPEVDQKSLKTPFFHLAPILQNFVQEELLQNRSQPPRRPEEGGNHFLRLSQLVDVRERKT